MPSSILDSEVHVWYCRPEDIQDEDKLSAYSSVLSEQERQQQDRFHFEKDKHSYLISHALLRHVLSKYADISVSDWQFTRNDHGKPELIPRGGCPKLNFNLTHTTGLCACVVTKNKICGIDVENIHRKNNIEAVAQRMFADEELMVLNGARSDQYQFYNFWTLREAYVKALGTGLAGSSKDFYFTVDEATLAATINYRKSLQIESRDWQFKIFEPTQEHRLSVALQSQDKVPVHIAEYIP